MSVEERLAILEKEMADLKRGITATKAKGNWIENVQGSFKDDPEFGEILRLGKEIREADKRDDNGDV
ncbi:MAG: hypothetical protein HYR84_06865 [Planctomycetes bacterium]|nr:hypothetical protein [Planctomycetota bacterium]